MENNQLEQPNLEPDNHENIFSETQDGSNYGKFKDAKTLLDAYNSLQAEFTRKSQKLAEIQKEREKNAVFETQDNIDEVLKDITDIDKYKKEITEILSNNNELSNLPNKYQVAFNLVKNNERKFAEQLNNPEILSKYIEENQELKNSIISKYLSTLNNISTAPKIISGNASNIHFSQTNNTPKTLKDAGEIFFKMLK